MTTSRSLVFLLLLVLPLSVLAGLSSGQLPNGTVWYLHADLAQMRNTDSGSPLFQWLDGEVLMKIHEQVGIDLSKEVNSITAFSATGSGTVILLEGPISSASEKKLLELAGLEAQVTKHTHRKMTYYFIRDDHSDPDEEEDEEEVEDDKHRNRGRNNVALDDFKEGAYVSFALSNKFLVTGNQKQMQELLDSKGKVAGSDSHNGALFVLTADKTFVQAGLNTDELGDDDDDWDSNIIRNTEQAAVMVSDFNGMIAVEAQLVSTDPKMAESIGGIANGLISLQAFNSELDPDIKSLLANTKVEVADNVLSINTVIAPDFIVSVLED